jgi:hypothetical protein
MLRGAPRRTYLTYQNHSNNEKKRSFYLDNFNKKVRMSECIMKHLFETPYTCMARHYSFFVFLGVRQFSAFKGEKIDKVTPIWH